MGYTKTRAGTTSVNVHIYPSSFEYRSRILKITKSLAEADIFEKIVILATASSELPEYEALDEKREVIRIRCMLGQGSTKTFWKVLRTVEWSLMVLEGLKGQKVACINCHTLSVLPTCIALKVLKRSKLVYDTHELETETVVSHGIRKHLLKILERLLIRFVDEIIVVNDSIAQWYKHEYRLKRVWVVRNVPYNQGENVAKTRILREAFGIRDEEIVYLYLGGIMQGRAILLLLDVFSRTHPSRHVVFMGFGPLTPLVQEYAAKYPNIHYHPAVALSDILKYASGADVGLALIENVCLSYYLCLPNKVFEYMMAGLPMVVSDFPDMAALVEHHDCGWKVAVDAEALLALVKTISLKEISAKGAKACGARCYFGWHLEEPTLLEVYRQMLGPKVGGRVPGHTDTSADPSGGCLSGETVPIRGL